MLGGIARGIIGHQVGSGRGNTAATIAGSVGGALAGQELNERMNGPRYRVTLRLDSGSTLIVEDDR